MTKLIKRFNLLTISLLLIVFTASCGQPQKATESTVVENDTEETSQEKEIDPEKLYSEAMEQISSGKTVEGMMKLAKIPFYNDAEDYLIITFPTSETI